MRRISVSKVIEPPSTARIPLRDPEVVQLLKSWIAGKPRNRPLWPGNWAIRHSGSKIVRQGLKAAGVPYEVDGRKADFHALRYTFVTNLIKAGENPAYVQRMARHSDINLTYGVYADLGLEDLYHGMLQGSHSSLQQGNEGQVAGQQTRGDKSRDEQSGENPDPKSVARNVAHFSVPRGLLASLDVTEGGCEDGDVRPHKRRQGRSQKQRATGDSVSCRSVSQDGRERRGGDTIRSQP